MEKVSEFELKTQKLGEITLKFYYNEKLSGLETGRVYVNDVFVQDFQLKDNVSEINFSTEPSSKVVIRIENDFDKAIDKRMASMILMSVECK